MKAASDIILIRHAQSEFNKATYQFSYQLGIHSWKGLLMNDEFNENVTFNSAFINSRLSEAGVTQVNVSLLQCKEQADKINQIKVDLVLVSPYVRALQTCNILFGHRSIPIIVEPIVGEVLRYSCDVPGSIENSAAEFKNFDFSRVQSLGDPWVLQNFSSSKRKILESQFTASKAQSLADYQQIILKLFRSHEIQESNMELRERVQKIKQMLTTYRQKYETIAVVSHNYTIEFIKSEGFTQDGELLKQHGIINCHPYFEQLSKLNEII